MIQIKSFIKIGVLASFVALSGARAVKSCSRAAKGGKNLDDVSRVVSGAGKSALRNGAHALSYIDDLGNTIDFLELSEMDPTIEDINIALDTSNLYHYFSHITPEMFRVDSIHHWNNMNFYIPKCYSIREYTSRKGKEVLEISYGLDRFIIKKVNLFSSNKSGWINNRKGILYTFGSKHYSNEQFEENYYLNTVYSSYQIFYIREDVEKKELVKCVSRLPAFIQLIALD